MSDNTKNWLYVVAVIVVPFILVHLFSDSYVPRLFSVIWAVLVLLCLFFLFAFNPKAKLLADSSRLNKTANPEVLKKWNLASRIVAFVVGLAWLIFIATPILLSVANVYILHKPLTIITDSVYAQSSTIFSPGLYWNLKLSQNPSMGYAYWLPTINRFGDSKYEFTILTGTNFILNVQAK